MSAIFTAYFFLFCVVICYQLYHCLEEKSSTQK